ncbi:hypothetical protein GDO81_018070 [Engystomops pustulosus]|uniref:Uncharacterized protein n=1 Tax=Engystomops pustulosus TaxID=76066 RepID=A0AAV7A4C8_ENGPU|nr:hypothetical protein GDO81_018070 [Engystomops pustulosus]
MKRGLWQSGPAWGVPLAIAGRPGRCRVAQSPGISGGCSPKIYLVHAGDRVNIMHQRLISCNFNLKTEPIRKYTSYRKKQGPHISMSV